MADKIERSIDVQAPIERVWRALTDHEEFGQWFRVRLDGPFEIGKPTTGRMTYPGYENVRWEGRTEVMDAPHRFVFSWPHPEDVHADSHADAPRTRVEFRLAASAGGTRVTVCESGFEAIPASRRTEAMRENGKGWDIQLTNIKTHVDA